MALRREITVAPKPDDAAMSFLARGKEQSEAALRVQKDLLDSYEKASSAWLGRVKSEVELWSALASKLATTQSPRKRWRPTKKPWLNACRWPRRTDGD
jgi:hypothetical protein